MKVRKKVKKQGTMSTTINNNSKEAGKVTKRGKTNSDLVNYR